MIEVVEAERVGISMMLFEIARWLSTKDWSDLCKKIYTSVFPDKHPLNKSKDSLE